MDPLCYHSSTPPFAMAADIVWDQTSHDRWLEGGDRMREGAACNTGDKQGLRYGELPCKTASRHRIRATCRSEL